MDTLDELLPREKCSDSALLLSATWSCWRFFTYRHARKRCHDSETKEMSLWVALWPAVGRLYAVSLRKWNRSGEIRVAERHYWAGKALLQRVYV